jgi:APA family basic amino acid/polyamine antiporter
MFSVGDAVALIIGIVVGVGIFKTPSVVAGNTENPTVYLLLWVLGGVISLLGALCYAELATTYPHSGGDYHYITRAFGRKAGFLFAWARMTVIQTGSIAMLSYVFGDYLSQFLPFKTGASPLCAVLAVVALTTLNVIGMREGRWTQNLLTALKVAGLLLIVVSGIILADPARPALPSGPAVVSNVGLAMIFILLTYGGWNEAAYISAELRNVQRNMSIALILGLSAITAIYLLMNLSLLKVLGLSGMGQSEAVASDAMRRIFGEWGAKFTGILIALSALGATNATIITGARSNFALGQGFPMFRFLGRWKENADTPANALVLQGAVSVVLILFGALTRHGFVTIVEYTAPVFWFFFFLASLSLFILRVREPHVLRPFPVPFYPLTPILFSATCVYMLYSSLAYTGAGALVGVVVLLAGVPFLAVAHLTEKGER